MREAPTVVLIGAGSTSFGLTMLHDLYADPVFTGSTVRLVAALTGSRAAALQALEIDPVVGSAKAAEQILTDYEDAHRDLWPALH